MRLGDELEEGYSRNECTAGLLNKDQGRNGARQIVCKKFRFGPGASQAKKKKSNKIKI